MTREREMKLFLLMAIALNLSFAKDEFHCFPESSTRIPVVPYQTFSFVSAKTINTNMGLNQIEFEEVVNKFSHFWTPILMNKYQRKLVFENDWNEERVDASASRDDDDNPIIRVFGGLVRHPEMTKNGMLLILCHELGHYFGGAPKNFRGNSNRRSWSSAEGQADYFATTKCMARMALNNVLYPETLPIKETPCQNETCLKIIPAALSIGNLFSSLKPSWKRPSLQQRSNSVVNKTVYEHPSPQCRLDTFIAGSLCSHDFDVDFDNSDYKVGSCTEDIEPEASRPKCWFSHNKY